jgi:alanine dehydrogenase
MTAGAGLLYLSRADLEALAIGMGEIVAAIDDACRAQGRGEAVMPPKLTLHGEEGSFSQVMAASLPSLGGLGTKWVTVFPGNAARGLPLINGLVVICDPQSGVPAAVMDAGPVTAWRTGASVAVAARYLARTDVSRIGVLGCGMQARSSVRALAAVLPGLRVVCCYDATPAAAQAFRAELQAEPLGLDVVVCAEAVEVACGAELVVSAITMTDELRPPLSAGLLEPGALAVALDYDAAWSAAAMAECERFYCDDRAAVVATKATGVRLAGIPAEIAGDLGELAAGRVGGRRNAAERLFCMNLGMALEDVVTAHLVLDRARELGVGRELPL